MLSNSRLALQLGMPELDDRAFVRHGKSIKTYISSGSSGPSEQKVTSSSIPDYAEPYVTDTLGRAQALTTQKPYETYAGQRVAGFTPMQSQAFQNIAGQQVAPQLTEASNFASQVGQAGLNTQGNAQQLQNAALGYGGMGAQYGAMGASTTPQAQAYGAQGAGIGGIGVQQAQQGFGAGQAYANQATDPSAMQNYMSPYMQNVVDVQSQEARRNADIQRQATQSQATQQGAFGGSRSAIVQSEADRNLATQLGKIQAEGSQKAYEDAQQAQQFGANLGIQGLQAGYQGLNTGLAGTAQGMTGAQTGISGQQAGLSGLNQAGNLLGQGVQGAALGLQGTGQRLAAGQLGLSGTAQGIQGAQAGLQGVGQQISGGQLGLSGAQTGIQGAQAGMQGAQAGLQGVGQATTAGQYGLAGLGATTQAANTLGQVGQTQYGQESGINQALASAGAQQQGLQQQGLDVGYQDFLSQQQYPYQQLAFMQSMYNPVATPLQQMQSSYSNPSPVSQVAGLGTAAYGLYQMGKKRGGEIKSSDGIDTLGLYNVMRKRG